MARHANAFAVVALIAAGALVACGGDAIDEPESPESAVSGQQGAVGEGAGGENGTAMQYGTTDSDAGVEIDIPPPPDLVVNHPTPPYPWPPRQRFSAPAAR